MISTHWLEKRRPHWERLESLLDKTGTRGIVVLSRDELRDLGLLYRQAAADLAVLREDPTSPHFARYLNQLLARAHHTIYAGQKGRRFAVWRFFAYEYPAVFRRNLGACALSLAVFLLSAAAGLVLTLGDPDFKTTLLGPSLVQTIERREMWTHSIVAMKRQASAGIMANNMSVAFSSFAMGITAGIGTLYMMALNGLLLGVIGTACWTAGMSLSLWSFVAPHGVLELPAIFIAGGAGFRLAHGLLFPGTLPRRQSLTAAGAESVRLVVGCIPLLVVAGVVEAFVSPTALAWPQKFLFAVGLFSMMTAYLFSRPAQAR